MNDCPANEKPSSILNDAQDYVTQASSSSFANVQARTSLYLAESAYADSLGHPDGHLMLFASAQKNVDDNSGFFGIDKDASTAASAAIELAKVAHFDKLNNPAAADLALGSAQKVVDNSYSSLSWDAYTLIETSIGLAKANHLDAQGKPDEAKKSFDDVTQSMEKFTSNITWDGVAARDVAIDLAKVRFFDRHDQPKQADAAFQAAQTDAVKNNGFNGPNGDTQFKLAAAVSIEEARRLGHRGDCSSANQILSDLAKRAEAEKGIFLGAFSYEAATKVNAAIAAAKIGMQTGEDVTPAISLLLTEHAMIGGKTKTAQ
jgi:hypothetical protein